MLGPQPSAKACHTVSYKLPLAVAYDNVLAAMSDPTRRAMLERLRYGPVSVGDMVAGLPVSRPAVSQHLEVLKDAGLVIDAPDGARRLYTIDTGGLAELRAWLDGFCDDADRKDAIA